MYKMKKLLYLFLAVTIISCGGDDDGNNTNNASVVNYFFEIEIGGEIHKIQGQFENDYPYYSPYLSSNLCVSTLYSGDQSIQLILSDITEENYVSGQPIQIILTILNAQQGNNSGSIDFGPSGLGSFLYEFAEQNNITFYGNNYVENTPASYTDAIQNDLLGIVSNIELSDLGTGPTIDSPNFSYGQNIEGTYQGILYFKDRDTYGGDAMFDIPVPIRISFSAVRTN